MAQADNSQFGTVLRELRLGLGFSVSEMAKEIGVDRGTVYRFEAGSLHPKMETLGRIALLASKRYRKLAPFFWKQFCSAFGTSVTELERAVFERAA